MLHRKLFLPVVLAFLASSAAIADDKETCMECHDADEFSDYDAAEIADAVRDTSIAKHKDKLAGLTDEQVQAIAAEMAGI